MEVDPPITASVVNGLDLKVDEDTNMDEAITNGSADDDGKDAVAKGEPGHQNGNSDKDMQGKDESVGENGSDVPQKGDARGQEDVNAEETAAKKGTENGNGGNGGTANVGQGRRMGKYRLDYFGIAGKCS